MDDNVICYTINNHVDNILFHENKIVVSVIYTCEVHSECTCFPEPVYEWRNVPTPDRIEQIINYSRTKYYSAYKCSY
jgi:hypothetical protein